MALAAGTRLGPYEITGAIGAGGMGEVYRARDSRLSRTVAIKVLPPHTAAQPEVRQRFEREARAVSALNHPHICTLYDIGQQDGLDYLVMEYLEGESLAERLKKGPLPIDQALRIATQVASALDQAHRKGITHRDLKPGNVMLTKDGAKVLDFGLAKMREPGSSAAFAGPGGSLVHTMTTPLTGEGSIVGTLQYMAPEQLEGRDADARSDIFAFGAVLYEMVTGRRAFEGASQASVIAAILEREPAPIRELQPLAPALLDRLVRACLAKDPDQRRQTAHDVLLDLQWMAESRAEPASKVQEAKPDRLRWTALVVAACVMVGAAVWLAVRPRAVPARTMRFGISLPAGDWFGGSWFWPQSVAISPDGTHIAYVATTHDGATQLYLREAAADRGHVLPGTEGASTPFFSADGRWLGAYLNGKLVKIPIGGGPPVTIASLPGNDPELCGATWLADGTIYIDVPPPLGLQKVTATDGSFRAVTKLDAAKNETEHRFPEMLPDGKTLLFTVRHADEPNFDEADIEALSLKTGERRQIVKSATDAHYLPSGHLVFLRGGVLLAAPFDPDKLQLQGAPVPVVESVIENPRIGAGQYAIAHDGTLVYIPGGVTFGAHELVYVDRSGATKVLTAKKRPYEDFTLSPDGKLIATTIEGPVTDTWIHDIARDTDTRFTFGVEHRDPAWSADGKRVAYSGYKDGKNVILWKAVDGTGAEEQLMASADPMWPWFWSRDGRFLVVSTTSPVTSDDIWILPMGGDRQPHPLLNAKFSEEWAQISPDGQWIAYDSDDTGREEVYVAPFPFFHPSTAQGLAQKIRISTEGGLHPQWSPNGRELYYRVSSGEEVQRIVGRRVKLMAMPIETSPVFKAGTPHVLFEGPFFDSGHDYAVTPDGKGFIFIRETQPVSGPTEMNVVLNWFEELKRRVPSGGQ